MSCFVMRGCAVSWTVMFAMRRDRVLRSSPGICPPVSPASRLRHGSLLSSPLRSVDPAPGFPGWRDPYSRVMRAGACALGRAFRAGAVCAPDCPGAPPRASRTQGAALPSPPRPFLRRRERMQPPDTASSRPCRGKACRCQRLRRNYYKYFMDNMPFSSLPAAASDSNLRAGAGVIRKSLMPSGERGGCVPPGASSSSPWAPRCNRKRRSDRECRKRKKRPASETT